VSIRRKRIGQAAAGPVWQYEDPAEHAAATMLVLGTGFDLAEYDDALEAATAAGASAAALGVLYRDRRLVLDQFRRGGVDAARAVAELLADKVRGFRLHALADIGEQVEHRLPPPGEAKTVYTPKTTAAKRAELHEQVRHLRARGKTNAAIAEATGYTVRQVQRIK
jgi:hypothetical protein